MKSNLRFFLTFLLCCAVFLIARACSVSLPFAQLIAFPFFVISLSQLKMFSKYLSRQLLFVALLLGSLGAVIVNNYQEYENYSVYVAKLNDDELEAKTRILRTGINELLQVFHGSQVLRFPKSITSAEEAIAAISESNATAIVWGKERWLTISFPVTKRMVIKEKFPTRYENTLMEEFSDFTLATETSVIGLSLNPALATKRFLSFLFAGITTTDHAQRESYLLQASEVASLWTSNAHRAYPIWLIGNDCLIDAIDQEEYEPEQLECAIQSYQKALGYLVRSEENSDLYAGIYNNHALAMFIKYQIEQKPEFLKRSVKNFLKAKKSGHRVDSPFDLKGQSWKIARDNLRQLHLRGLFELDKLEKKLDKGFNPKRTKKSKRANDET